MKLKLNGIKVDCVIGERPDERGRTQRLRVNVEMEIPGASAATDELSDTVDYALLTDRIRSALMEAECRLIERAAKVVAEACLFDEKVTAVRVSVIKSGSIPHLESAEVVYEQSRRKSC